LTTCKPTTERRDNTARSRLHWTAAVVELTISDSSLHLHVLGADKLWALKSSLEIPLQHIAGIRADAEAARGWWHGIRLPGTNVPGVITAGTFYQDGKRVFWDVHHPENTVIIELRDDRYDELIVEVADPLLAVETVRAVLPAATEGTK